MAEFPQTFPFYFDPSAPTIVDEQKSASYRPVIIAELTKDGETSYTFKNTDRLTRLELTQKYYREDGTIVLYNSDLFMSDLDLLNYSLTIKMGFLISGIEKTVTFPPLKITAQSYLSQMGKAVCVLQFKGIMSLVSIDFASMPYSKGGNAKSLVDEIFKATLEPFTHCQAYETVWHGDTGLSGINIFDGTDLFSIELNYSRMYSAQMLLELSDSLPRPEADGKIHFRVPKTTGTDYDYTFELDGHTFFWKNKRNNIIIPNAVKVTASYTDYWGEDHSYSGTATSEPSYSSRPVWYYIYAGDLRSNDDCTALAESILNSIILADNKGEFEAPPCIYLKLGDYIKVTDIRQGDGGEVSGNASEIVWQYGDGKFRQIIGIGGFLINRNTLKMVRDYEPEDEKFFVKNWLAMSCPKTWLYANQYIFMGIVPLTKFRHLLLGHYSVWANSTGGCVGVGIVEETYREVEGGGSVVDGFDITTIIFLRAASSPVSELEGWRYARSMEHAIHAYTSYDNSMKIGFFLMNTGGAPVMVSGHIAFDIQWSGGLP